MAFDEWMLAEAATFPRSLLVRLYTWEIGTITFGYNQKAESALDFSKLGDTPVIRRVTGGRAVYHDLSELTYSVAFNTAVPLSNGLAGTISRTSENLANVLSLFLQQLGVSSEWVKKSSRDNASPVFFHKAACFASHAKYELVSEGRKLVASARRDWNGAALQHGSVKLQGLAPHPALNSLGGEPQAQMEYIDLEQLMWMGQVLVNAIDQAYGIRVAAQELPASEQVDLEKCIEQIAQNPTARREMIAQNQSLHSL